MGEYKKVAELGRGTYGTVYWARRPDKTEVAVKRLYTETSKHPGVLCLRELEMAITCVHPNLAHADKVLHSSPFREPLSPRRGNRTDRVFLEFSLACCDLDWLVTKVRIDPGTMKDAMIQVSRGLEYLHNRNIIHRDIKPDNVLVYVSKDGKTLSFKLGDFGFSKPLSKTADNTPKMYYVDYRAPELLLKYRWYRSEPDIWALGCMFAEIVTGKSLFAAAKKASNKDRLTKIVKIVGASDRLVEIAIEMKMPLEVTAATTSLPSSIHYVQTKLFDSIEGIKYSKWLQMLGKMLDTDMDKRIGIGQVLTYLGQKPIESVDMASTMINIRDCPCRTTAIDMVKLCGLQTRWLHHCIDLINRLTYTINLDPKHLVTAVVSIVSKYWDIELAPSLGTLLASDIGKGFRGKQLEEYESMLEEKLGYRIYRPLLCDLVDSRVPEEILLDAMTLSTSNGMSMETLASQLSGKYDTVTEAE